MVVWQWAVVFLVRDLRCNSYVVTLLLVLELMWIDLMLDLI